MADQADDPDHRQKHSHGKAARPTVHYPDDLDRGPGPTPTHRWYYSSDGLNSRPSSIVGTDDEDSEDYDWSGEEDLADEEAKFEERMGVRNEPTGWSFKR